MNKSTIISILVCGTLLTGSQALAWSGEQGSRGYHGNKGYGQRLSAEQYQQRQARHLEKMAVILDLTEEQKKDIQTLHEQRQQQLQNVRTQLLASREQLREAETGKDFDEAQFRAIAQQHAELKTRMMVDRAKARQQITALLTPEQQEKAQQLGTLHGGWHDGKKGKDRRCDKAAESGREKGRRFSR